jgi:hypothetical protein
VLRYEVRNEDEAEPAEDAVDGGFFLEEAALEKWVNSDTNTRLS